MAHVFVLELKRKMEVLLPLLSGGEAGGNPEPMSIADNLTSPATGLLKSSGAQSSHPGAGGYAAGSLGWNHREGLETGEGLVTGNSPACCRSPIPSLAFTWSRVVLRHGHVWIRMQSRT